MSETVTLPGETRRSKKRTVVKGSEEHLAIVRGPLIEQVRQKELRIDCMKAEAEEQRAEILKLEARERELEQRARIAEKALEQERSDGNDLRSRLMGSELAYAKLRGYLEGKRDSEPPVMVPQQREPFHAQLSDGSFGTASLDWRQDGSGRSAKHWYHR